METIKVTDFAEFYKATANGETRYYATREAAMSFDPSAVKVKGFAVYDTTVAGSWAVALHPTKEEAKAHEPTPSMEAPTSAVETDNYEDEDFGAGLGTPSHLDEEDDENEDNKKPSKKPRKFAKAKRGR